METLERYISDISSELDINDINVREVQMRAPGRKHFWVARLIGHKRQLEFLKKDRDDQIQKISDLIQSKVPVKLPVTQAKQKAKEHDTVKKIDDKIKEEELIIELLESTVRNYESIHWAIKNIVEIMKLETM